MRVMGMPQLLTPLLSTSPELQGAFWRNSEISVYIKIVW
jgi:hypothetical protein